MKRTIFSQKAAEKYLLGMPDDVLKRIQFSVPWQYDESGKEWMKDSDGFIIRRGSNLSVDYAALQQLCWEKFNENPQINTAIRDKMGRLTGFGFDITSDNTEIQNFIDLIWTDPRNRLYLHMPKFVARSDVEGELFLALTLHADGFVEVDFRDPSTVKGKSSGIIYHPTKPTMPLAYCFEGKNGEKEQIPSIFCAYYPDLFDVLQQTEEFDWNLMKKLRVRGSRYKDLNGFRTFIVQWDKGFLTNRNISHLRTTLKWINHYENLKLYEIDHKKSAGAYLWIITMEDARAFKKWLSLTDEQRAKTGIMAKKTPGGTLILPPGMKLEVKNPQLPNISGSDTDILEMVTSGLNMPADMVTGSAKGPFSSVKALRGPQSDRVSDDICYFEKFLRYDFWRPIFFLGSKMGIVKYEYRVRECVGFTDGDEPEPKIDTVKRKAHELVEFSFPTTEVSDIEARARATLGVKHGSISDTLGIPYSEVAKRLGFGSYKRMRMRHATEAKIFPKLQVQVDQEQMQEKKEGEKPKVKKPTNEE
jgi:hypothetical protein